MLVKLFLSLQMLFQWQPIKWNTKVCAYYTFNNDRWVLTHKHHLNFIQMWWRININIGIISNDIFFLKYLVYTIKYISIHLKFWSINKSSTSYYHKMVWKPKLKWISWRKIINSTFYLFKEHSNTISISSTLYIGLWNFLICK